VKEIGAEPTTNWKLLFIYLENIARVKNLIQLYEDHPKSKGSGRKPVQQSDILRAAVVLQHATFEEMCRTVEIGMLPMSNEETLNDIPLLGLSRAGRPEKIFLGKLLPHKKKQVEKLIEESISAHVNQTTYNSVEDFCGMLSRIGVDPKPFQHLFPLLTGLIERRHHIVHQADKNLKRGASGQQSVRTINKEQVKQWNDCLSEIQDLLGDVKLLKYFAPSRPTKK
jgi:hypothetical protein